MTLLVQITDTHILPPGELLYGQVDTAIHLRDRVEEINRIRPVPDVVMITGDLVENPSLASYEHFKELIKTVSMPVYVIPGNHDDPAMMVEYFADTPYFPASHLTCQYTVDDFEFRILGLNSYFAGSELPEYDGLRLEWLRTELQKSEKPTLIAIHHPPMKTGIEFIDMGGSEWFSPLASLLAEHPQVHLVICGHCHTDLIGRIGNVPVYMAGSTAHQLVAARGVDIAPSFDTGSIPPVLHHFLDGSFLSGSMPWPLDAEEKRIDRESGIDWEELKTEMKGSKAP